MASPVDPERVVLGLACIGVGTVWLLANLGWVDMLGTLRRLWPSLLVIWGALELYNTAVHPRRRSPAPPAAPPAGSGSRDSEATS